MEENPYQSPASADEEPTTSANPPVSDGALQRALKFGVISQLIILLFMGQTAPNHSLPENSTSFTWLEHENKMNLTKRLLCLLGTGMLVLFARAGEAKEEARARDMTKPTARSAKKQEAAVNPAGQAELAWFEPTKKPFELFGFAWFDKERIYRRFPEKVGKTFPRAEDSLAWCTSGGRIRFRTDSKRVVIRAKLRGHVQMVHMPRTGSSGFDLYIGEPGHERFWAVAADMSDEFQKDVYRSDKKALQSMTIYFPLYQGVEKVEIGLEKDSAIREPIAMLDNDRAIAIYAGSITQGGCSSRSGMSYPNVLSRLLGRNVYNFGFSGAGRGEPEVAQLIADIPNLSMIVLKYEGNAGDRYQPTLARFLDILRAKHPDTPIVILSLFRFQGLYAGRPNFAYDRLDANIRFQQSLIKARKDSGDKNLFWINGGELLGDRYSEATVDGAHLTDWGAQRVAEELAPRLKKVFDHVDTAK